MIQDLCNIYETFRNQEVNDASVAQYSPNQDVNDARVVQHLPTRM